VLYPWHPWHGQGVHVIAVVRQRGIEVWRCRLNPNDPGRPLEIPAWMFDRVVCRRMRRVEALVVSCEQLTHLYAFLKEQKARRMGDRAEMIRIVPGVLQEMLMVTRVVEFVRGWISSTPKPERPDWPTLPQEVRLRSR
jgi:hypothetical protein